MSKALYIPVSESLVELRSLHRQSSLMYQPRIKMLICMKKASAGISKRELMSQVSASSQSIHNWRSLYKQGGLEALLSNSRKGKAGKPSVFSKEEHLMLEQKLKDPKNGLAGYIELQQWIAEAFSKEVKYNTVLKYAMKHFGTRVKVARKSHAGKDELSVQAFKKTSLVK